MIVSVYKTITDSKNPLPSDIKGVLNSIKGDRFKPLIQQIRIEQNKDKRNELKMKLPAVNFSGEFTERSVKGFVKSSNIVCLDFDGLTKAGLVDLKMELIKDKYVYSLFTSPSGLGLKVLVKSEFNSPEEYKQRFYALDRHFKMKKSFDMSTSDISRGTYFSYDPEIYINNDSELFEEKVESVSTYTQKRSLLCAGGAMAFLEKWLSEKKGMQYAQGHRNHYVFMLSAALCRFGIEQSEAQYEIQTKYTDLSQHEITNVVNSAYKRNDFGVVDILEYDIEQDSQFYAKMEFPDFKFDPESVISNAEEDNQVVFNIAAGLITSQSFGCSGIDKYFPLKTNELYAFVAASKAGKTLILSYLALMAAKWSNWRFIVLTTETLIPEYKSTMVSFLLDKPIKVAGDNGGEDDIIEALEFIDEHFLFLKNEVNHTQIMDVYHWAKSKNDYYDCVIIDPISNVAKSDKITGKGNEYHDQLYSEYLRFCKNHCALWIVAHVTSEKERARNVVFVQDAEFGSYLARRCDNGVTFYRDLYDEERKRITEMHIRFVRTSLTRGGEPTNSDTPIEFDFYFDGANFRYNVNIGGDEYINPLINGDSMVQLNDLV